MDTGGGTGATEQDSESDSSDIHSTELHITLLPARLEPVGEFPNTRYIAIHTICIHDNTTRVTIEVRGLDRTPASFLLFLGETIIRAARSRVRQGTVQITSL